MLQEDGQWIAKDVGTGQGNVLSPLLSNIFLHFAFDTRMKKYHPAIPFERYCDDVIVHCKSEQQAKFIKDRITERMQECKLSLNLEKTHIVYCRNTFRREDYPKVSFDFLGYTL